VNRRERQLHLSFDAGGPGDAKLRPRPDRIVQERTLADARLSMHDQHVAVPVARGFEQAVERLALTFAPKEVSFWQPDTGRCCVHLADKHDPSGRGLKNSWIRSDPGHRMMHAKRRTPPAPQSRPPRKPSPPLAQRHASSHALCWLS